MASETQTVPNIRLRGDVDIPQLGFGVFQVPPDETAEAVKLALQAGYRHIDTAAAYKNETGVAEAIKSAGVSRDEVFVTTKCFNDDHGYEDATKALDTSLERLGFDHVDLYLIHWPVPSKDLYVETWRALIDAQKAGKARAIGVSNFKPPHLERIIDETGVTPAINQVELHPYLQQGELRAFHEEHGIVTEAWSPLARGAVLDDPTLTGIAERVGRSPGQVVIRWHLQLGNVAIPKSVTPERIEENFAVFDFHLTEAEMAAIEQLDVGERTGPDPDTFVRPPAR